MLMFMTTSDMTALDAEAAAIYDAIDAIVETTKFNGVILLGFSTKFSCSSCSR